MVSSKKSWLTSLFIALLVVVTSVITTHWTVRRALHMQPPIALAQENQQSHPIIKTSDFQQALRDVSAQTLQGVVRVDAISIKKVAVKNQQSPWDFFFSQDFFNRSEDQGEEREFRSGSLGTGFVVEREKNILYILTNYHVAGEAHEVSVEFVDGRNFTAEILAGDERKDLALLKVDVGSQNNDLLPLPLGDSNSLVVGDWVLAAGSPFGYDFSVTAGIVSALGRTGGPRSNINDFIQTDTSINQGNSGGPLVNMHGEVIGINTWIATQSGGSVGLSFSVPINNAKEALPYLKSGKTPDYGWVGVSVLDIRSVGGESYASSAGFTQTKGAIIATVFKGSPADKAGLYPGDLVLSVNGTPVNNADRLVYLVGSLAVGSKAQFDVIRDGKELTVSVLVEARTKDAGENTQSKSWPGVIAFPITPENRKELHLDNNQTGVIISSSDPGSPLSFLKPRDVVTSINGQKITSIQTFYRAINAPNVNGRYEIIFKRDGSLIEITVRKE
ncbi:trypsin-like peptidase domain-containing protein [Entomospira nematocerorum]|uniref:PDZ domain-containing protein n=1 Tax=Entomospira nematocerorum TaxID=2719987 RepID=A0A968GBR7_9SPIO|nr:trypsin-like peptidase domain-containing protein [Entomospira nematocera]NIZ46940.1 PDZ domain-containing protein [Entomospira nematocera]WDI33263.1 trypsin-like peptidase domain-containing protein [Entomospira nematocera]